jgi:alcohol dehydrogenase (cytochrome c)
VKEPSERRKRILALHARAIRFSTDIARLGTSAQGFPVSFAIDGRQYIGVMSGLGGGSPRNVPAAIVPDIKIPQSGQALYVFALPEGR